MSMKPTSFFIPSYEPERRIQCDIPASLAAKADAIRKARHLTWSRVMCGLLQKMVEDLTPGPASESVALRADMELEKILKAQTQRHAS